MSKFLKFIVHFVVICAIIIALGLTIPPFFGVETVIVTNENQKTNLPMGSVTYAIPVKTVDVYEGDPILVQEDSNTYRYNVARIDQTTRTGTVIDPSVTDGREITVAMSDDYVKKVLITLGYVGYLLIATRSTEGLIILGLVILFLIILYIIAELWKKDDRYDEDEHEDTPAGYVKSAKELKREEKARAKRMKEEAKEIAEEERSGRKKKKAEKKKVRTGGFVDEIDEDDDEEEEEQQEESVPIQPAVGEAHEYLRKEVAAATAGTSNPVSSSGSIQQEVMRVLSGEAEKQPIQPVQPTQTLPEEVRKEPEPFYEEPEPLRRRAIPGYTPTELADQAKAVGDTPDIMKDEITEVTLFDYSDILNED